MGKLIGLEEVRYRLVDSGGGVGLAEEIEHEAGRTDGSQRVGDILPRDVVRGPMYGLEHRRSGASRVEVRRCRKADPSAHRPGQVARRDAEEEPGNRSARPSIL